MRRLFLMAAIAVGAIASSASEAKAFNGTVFGPSSTSVTWPGATPSGWYTNTYNYAWYYPWFAYYNYAQGPYANWMAGGGYAGYATSGPGGHFFYPGQPTQPFIGDWYDNQPNMGGGDGGLRAAFPAVFSPQWLQWFHAPHFPRPALPGLPIHRGSKPCKVCVSLPDDAKLLFNGVASTGTGGVRTFETPALEPGQNYKYELTAEVVRAGRVERVTETVIVRAGETAQITLKPTAISTASAK